MSAALASKHGYFEASLEELVKDGWPKVTRGLRERLVLVLREA